MCKEDYRASQMGPKKDSIYASRFRRKMVLVVVIGRWRVFAHYKSSEMLLVKQADKVVRGRWSNGPSTYGLIEPFAFNLAHFHVAPSYSSMHTCLNLQSTFAHKKRSSRQCSLDDSAKT
jgi:hypothetical protein